MGLFYSSLASTLAYLVNMGYEKQNHSIRGIGIVSTYIQLSPIAYQDYLRLTGLVNIHAQFFFSKTKIFTLKYYKQIVALNQFLVALNSIPEKS